MIQYWSIKTLSFQRWRMLYIRLQLRGGCLILRKWNHLPAIIAIKTWVSLQTESFHLLHGTGLGIVSTPLSTSRAIFSNGRDGRIAPGLMIGVSIRHDWFNGSDFCPASWVFVSSLFLAPRSLSAYHISHSKTRIHSRLSANPTDPLPYRPALKSSLLHLLRYILFFHLFRSLLLHTYLPLCFLGYRSLSNPLSTLFDIASLTLVHVQISSNLHTLFLARITVVN